MFFTHRDADWLSECGGEVGDWFDAGVVGPSAWVDDSWWVGLFKLAGLSIRIQKSVPRFFFFVFLFFSSFLSTYYFISPPLGEGQRAKYIYFCI